MTDGYTTPLSLKTVTRGVARYHTPRTRYRHDGSTPLAIARKKNRADAIRVLTARGAK